MDADVSDSAGTPARPETPADVESQTDAPGADDNGATSDDARSGAPASGEAGDGESTEDGKAEGADTSAAESPAAADSEDGKGAETSATDGETAETAETAENRDEDGAAVTPDDADSPATDGKAADAPADGDATTESPADADADADAENVAAATTSTAGGPGGGHTDTPPPPANPANPRRRWMRWAALGTSVVVLAAAGTGWWLYNKLDGNITTDTKAAAELQTYEKDRPKPVALDALNILLIGSDSRAGDNGKYGRDDGGSSRSDTTILLHLAADRKSATAVSLPRDLMVHIPACGKPDGSRTRAQFAQFNWAYEFGGTACTIRTVEKLTGVRIDHQMVIDFHGFKGMVDAVGGVEVCLKDPVDDTDAQLKLPAGQQTLNGEQALGFVRARHGIGDGSDTQRMDRQQRFLGALFKKVQSNGVLLNPTRLYPVLDAATKSITTDPGLASLKDLYNLVRSMRSVPTEQVQFLTVPRQPYSQDRNRDELVQPEADKLFKQLRDDQPVSVTSGDEKSDGPSDSPSAGDPGDKASASTNSPGPTGSPTGSPDGSPSGSPAPTPTFTGSNAAAGMCE